MKAKAIRLYFSVLVLGLFVALFVSVSAHAQVAGATLSGTVTDPQGGVVPKAHACARDTATGIESCNDTNDVGIYTIPNLKPDDYEVTVTASGFSSATVKITLTVGQKAELNVPLVV